MENAQEDIENTLELLRKGDKLIDMFTGGDRILLVGNTGAGKSTLTQFIAGDNALLHSVDVGTGDFVIEDGHRISNSTFESHTTFPELVVDNETNVGFYDCPGFNDTRGTCYDIASTYFIKKIVSSGGRVKIILIVSYSSVRPRVDRQDLFTLIQHVARFIRDVNKYRNGIAIVATKVDNITKKKENAYYLVPDTDVVSGIADVLKELKQHISTVNTESTNFIESKITLIDILLTKENGEYTRIGIFRRPDETGSLASMSSLLQQEKMSIKTLIRNNLDFVETDKNDFGFTVSEKSRNDINDLKDATSQRITHSIQSIVRDLQIYYQDKEKSMKDVREFVQEMNQCIEALAQMYTSLSELKDPSGFVRILSTTLRDLHAPIKMDDLQDISECLDHLDFMNRVTARKLVISTAEWRYAVMSAINQLKQSRAWYMFLLDLHRKFLWVGVPRDKQFPITEENSSKSKDSHYTVTTFFSSIENYGVTELDNARSIPVDETKLKALNEVIDSNMELELKVETVDDKTLVVRGGVVKLSKLKISSLPVSVKCIQIFASDSVVIDEDIIAIGQELQVCILAPKWEVIGRRKIVLDGKAAQTHAQEKAASGRSDGENGVDGIPGLPGGNGGDFFGLGDIFVNGRDLSISTRGGNGGKGQAGGDGANGVDGRDVDFDPGDHYYIYDIESSGFELKSRTFHIPYIKYKYEKRGDNGTAGGNGGDGGKGGYGGKGGENVIYALNGGRNVNHIKGNGFQGETGEFGMGGKGGKNGKCFRIVFNAYMDLSYVLVPLYLGMMITREFFSPSILRANSGRMGDLNIARQISPELKVVMLPKAEVINIFKAFLFSITHHKVIRSYILNFIKKMDSNRNIRESYDTLRYAKELENLETALCETIEPVDVIPFYESLLERVKNYSEKIEAAQKGDQTKEVLKHLYIAILSKMYVLKRRSEHSFVANISGFLDGTLEHIRNFQEMCKEEFVNRLRENYKQKIDVTIDEAIHYIREDLIPEIDNFKNEIDRSIDEISDDILTLQQKSISEMDRQMELEVKLKTELQLRAAFEVLKTVSKVLSFYGTIGCVMCVAIEKAEPLILQKGLPRLDVAQIPQGVRNLLLSTQDFVTKYRRERILELQQQLAELSAKVASNSEELEDLIRPIEDIRERLSAANEISGVHLDDIEDIEEDLRTQLEMKMKCIGKNSDNALKAIENALKVLVVADFCTDVCRRYKRDASKLGTISNAILQTKDNIKKLKDYENQVHTYLSPIVREVQSQLRSVQNSLPSLTRIFLSVTNRRLQRQFEEMKLKMCMFTKDLRSEERIACCFDKLMETFNTLIGVYDQIKSYSEQKEFADYIADLNSRKFPSSEIVNEELHATLKKVDKLITFSIVLSEYERFVAAFKQWVFPFADHFLNDFALPSTFASNYDIDKHTSDIQRQLEFLKKKLTNYTSSVIVGMDNIIHHEVFNSEREGCKPFFVWRNKKNKRSISKLLSGQAVTLKSDILDGVNKDSLKFRLVEINLKCPVSVQKEMNEMLKQFRVSLKHHGNSYYQYGRKFYIIRSECQTVEYSYERSENGTPVSHNSVYGKIKNGEFILSPYAMWTIQLFRCRGEGFNELKEYENCVDLELVGEGQYVKKDLQICESKLQWYYETDDSISRNDI